MMKVITTNLLKYALAYSFLTLLFRFALSKMIEFQFLIGAGIVSALFAIGIFSISFIFVTKNRTFLPFYDVGFRLHLTGFLSYHLVTELWYLFDFQAQNESIIVTHLISFIWGILLLFHFIIYLITRKNTIRGLNKSELFD